MRACRDFAYEPSNRSSRKKHRSSDGKNMQRSQCDTRFHPHGILRMLLLCTLYRFDAFAPVLAMQPNASYFLCRLANRMTLHWLWVTKSASCERTNRIGCWCTLHKMCSYCKTRYRSVHSNCKIQLMFLSGCCHSLYLSFVRTRGHSRSTADLNVAWFCCVTKCYTARRQFRKAFDCASIQFTPSTSSSSGCSCDRTTSTPFFSSASIEIVRHDLFIQTWTLRFNLNGFFSIAIDITKKTNEPNSNACW